MKTILSKPILGFILMVLLGLSTSAQETQDQVKIKITREIDGEEKTFEKTYASEEEMKKDPEFKEFMGNDKTNFWLSPGHGPKVIELKDLESEDGNGFFFSFGPPHPPGEPHHFRFKSDSSHGFFYSDREGDWEDIEETLKEHFEKMEANGIMISPDFDFDFDFEVSDSLADNIRIYLDKHRLKEGDRKIEVRVFKRIVISENVEEFGKKGEVKKSELLVLDDLNYYPNPAPNGRFKLKFNTPGEGELAIRIYNMDGKEVFNRYFTKYGGLYSESIDLSQQNEGMYLLEVQFDGKRLTRKIVVN